MKSLKAPGSVGDLCQGRGTPEGLQPWATSARAWTALGNRGHGWPRPGRGTKEWSSRRH